MQTVQDEETRDSPAPKSRYGRNAPKPISPKLLQVLEFHQRIIEKDEELFKLCPKCKQIPPKVILHHMLQALSPAERADLRRELASFRT